MVERSTGMELLEEWPNYFKYSALRTTDSMKEGGKMIGYKELPRSLGV